MKKILVLYRNESFDDLQVLENLKSMLIDVKVIPVEISCPYRRVMRNLLKFCFDIKPDVIVGLSDCAMFAQQLHGYKKVLANPVLHVSWGMITDECMQLGGVSDFDKEHSYFVTSINGNCDCAYTWKIEKGHVSFEENNE